MADNYLERRMEDYRNGKLSSRRMSAISVKRPSMALRVFILGGDTESGKRYVTMLRSYDWKVAFTDPDLKSGRELAQSSGSQHHPVDVNDEESLTTTIRKACDAWGAVDLIIDCTDTLADNVGEALEALGVPVIKAL